MASMLGNLCPSDGGQLADEEGGAAPGSTNPVSFWYQQGAGWGWEEQLRGLPVGGGDLEQSLNTGFRHLLCHHCVTSDEQVLLSGSQLPLPKTGVKNGSKILQEESQDAEVLNHRGALQGHLPSWGFSPGGAAPLPKGFPAGNAGHESHRGSRVFLADVVKPRLY